ncbi:pyridoxamine 5'-phosphate oxidase [Anaplasma phagocytophilum]|uniref:pyridoxamine 5'-phosphate oxidase n=1 Tax=Anaplasma phagocytophilum TaxID=948 RepID=UPI0009BCA5B3|nr:pyridoxamine 5'-phosphate oxidase [Anaplasma phagocytophilum]
MTINKEGLRVDTCSGDPMSIFGLWYEEVLRVKSVREPSAMVLATCDSENRPSARVVLLKRYSDAGFEFYTNLESRKAREIALNPCVSLVFDWRHIYKQVRVEGIAEFMDVSESDAYFASRSRESQIGAWCSRQSMILEDRDVLLSKIELMEREYEGREIPRPKFWGGIRVVPNVIEFWMDGKHRLHDRRQYSKNIDGTWTSVYLYP